MTATCWVRLDGDDPQPVSSVELRAMAEDGRVSPDTLVSLDGTKWARAARIRGLFVESAPLPPPVSDAAPEAPPRQPEFQAVAEVGIGAADLISGPPAGKRPHWSSGRSRLAPLGIAAVAGCLLGILGMTAVWIFVPRTKPRADGASPRLAASSQPSPALQGINDSQQPPRQAYQPAPKADAPTTSESSPANAAQQDNLSTGNLSTDNLSTGNLSTGNLSTGNLSTGNLSTGNLSTGNLSTGNLSTGALPGATDIGPPSVATSDGSPLSPARAVANDRPPQSASNELASSSVVIAADPSDSTGAGKIGGAIDAKQDNAAGGLAMTNLPPAVPGMAAAPAGMVGAGPAGMVGAAPAGMAGAAPMGMAGAGPMGVAGAAPGLMNQAPGAGLAGVAPPNRQPLQPAGAPPVANDRVRRRALVLGQGGTPESEAAVEAALVWLAEHQLADGGWSFDHQVGACQGRCDDPGHLAEARIGATAMALLPFLAAGYTFEEGPYQQQIAAGLNFLIHSQKSDGSLWEPGGTFYSHGMATLALCDAYNMIPLKPDDPRYVPGGLASHNAGNVKLPATPAEQRAARAEMAKATKAAKASIAQARKKPLAKEPNAAAIGAAAAPSLGQMPVNPKLLQMAQLGLAAQRALDYIVASQSPYNGGWRYEPGQAGDTSVVGWQCMALKAGLMAKLRVPQATFAGVSGFLDSVQSNYGANYGYLNPGRGTPATTAIGLLLRMQLGWDHNRPGLADGAMALVTVGPSPDDMYYNLYASQVLRNYGGPGYEKWNPIIRDYLIQSQVKLPHVGGSWYFDSRHAQMGGRLYNTVLSTLILEVYYRYEPVYPAYPANLGSPGEATSKALAEKQKAAAPQP